MSELKCIMCGKTYPIETDRPNLAELTAAEKPAVYVCDSCNRKVQHESEEKRKPTRPASS